MEKEIFFNSHVRKDKSFHRAKEIVMTMNGMTEEGFNNRMMNDPYFRSGFDVIHKLIIDTSK